MILNINSNVPDKPAATAETTEESGFWENHQNSLGMAMTEDLPITSRMIPTTTETMRNKKIYDYQKSGEISPQVMSFFGDDIDGLGNYANKTLGLSDIPTHEEYEEQKLSEYKQYREYSGKIQGKQNAWGVAGSVTGHLHAMALDPLYATSFLTGYGSTTTVLQAALRVGAMEAGIELAAQPPKMAWKEEVGADYGAAEALTQVVFAGLGSSAIAAGGKALGKVFTPKDLTVAQGIKVLEKFKKENPEVAPILNTLTHADPEDNLAKVMQADEAIDIEHANLGPKQGADPIAHSEIKADEIQIQREESFYERTSDTVEGTEEGVTHVTPKKDISDWDQAVYHIDDNLKTMEGCF